MEETSIKLRNKAKELAVLEEAVEYLKTDFKIKLKPSSEGIGEFSFFNTLTSKHIELMALSFVKWFIENPEEVAKELKLFILNEAEESFTAEFTVINILIGALVEYEEALLTENYETEVPDVAEFRTNSLLSVHEVES